MRRLPPWLLDSGTCCKLTHSLVFVFTMQFACTDNSLFYCLPAFALCTLQHKFPPFTSALSTLSAPHFQRTSHRVQVTNSLSFSCWLLIWQCRANSIWLYLTCLTQVNLLHSPARCFISRQMQTMSLCIFAGLCSIIALLQLKLQNPFSAKQLDAH